MKEMLRSIERILENYAITRNVYWE